MDTSLLLSGEQLLALKIHYQEEKTMRRRRRGALSRGFSSKRSEIPQPGAAMRGLELDVERQLRDRINALKTTRVRSMRDMGQVEWCPENSSSKVVNQKKRPAWMGYMDGNQLMYTSEETLFLLEAESILCYHNQLPMNLQEAYQTILADEKIFRRYKAYSSLSRLGYKLKPFQSNFGGKSVATSSQATLEGKVSDVKSASVTPLHVNSLSSVQETAVDLKLVKMPLRREMFLNGTSFDQIATWAEYKRLTDPRNNPNEIYDEEATVLELNSEICSSKNIFSQLPNKSLIDQKNRLKPLIDQTKIMDIHKLHQIFKEAGPQQKNLHSSLPSSKSPPQISYKVFLPSVKNFSNAQPEYHLVVCSDSHPPPMIQELMSIHEECGQAAPVFAVISQVEFSAYTFEPFDCWEEIPTFWDPNYKSK